MYQQSIGYETSNLRKDIFTLLVLRLSGGAQFLRWVLVALLESESWKTSISYQKAEKRQLVITEIIRLL